MERRTFLIRTGLGLGAAALTPRLARAGAAPEWNRVRDEFPLSRDYVHLAGFFLASHPTPVREAIAKLGETPFPPFDEYAPFKILVTGGSQGAKVLSKVVPEGLGMLPPSLTHRLHVIHQFRPDDNHEVSTK